LQRLHGVCAHSHPRPFLPMYAGTSLALQAKLALWDHVMMPEEEPETGTDGRAGGESDEASLRSLSPEEWQGDELHFFFDLHEHSASEDEHEHSASEDEREAASSMLELSASAIQVVAAVSAETAAAAEVAREAEATKELAAEAETKARARAAAAEEAVAAAKEHSAERALDDATKALQVANKIVEEAAAAAAAAAKQAESTSYRVGTLRLACDAAKRVAASRAATAELARIAVVGGSTADDFFLATDPDTPETREDMAWALQEPVAPLPFSLHLKALPDDDPILSALANYDEPEPKPKPKPYKGPTACTIEDGPDDSDLANAAQPGWKLGVMTTDRMTAEQSPKKRRASQRSVVRRYRLRQIKATAAGQKLPTDLLMAYLRSDEGRQVDPLCPERLNQITWTLKSENCWFTTDEEYTKANALRIQYRNLKRNRAEETRQHKRRKGLKVPVKMKPTSTKHDNLRLPMPSAHPPLIVPALFPSYRDICPRPVTPPGPPPSPPRRSCGDSGFASENE
jgi:chemotaxis protein histidine kinase CheA